MSTRLTNRLHARHPKYDLMQPTVCSILKCWVEPAIDWIECRQTRNFMIRDYLRDMVAGWKQTARPDPVFLGACMLVAGWVSKSTAWRPCRAGTLALAQLAQRPNQGWPRRPT